MMKSRTLFLLTNDDIGWAALRSSLVELPDAHIVDEAEKIEDARARIATCKPDIVLSGATVADTSALPFLAEINRTLSPASHVIIFGNEPDEDESESPPNMGLVSYVLWSNLRGETLPALLTLILRGDFMVGSRTVVQRMREKRLGAVASDTAGGDILNPLTCQQCAVLRLVNEGLGNAEIADRLCVSVETVKRHLQMAYDRLGIHRRDAAGNCARKRGWLG